MTSTNDPSGATIEAPSAHKSALAGAPSGPIPIQSLGIAIIAGIALIAGLQLFYATVYSVHTDLAGAALSGRLALTLGDSFGDYSLYFPPAEKIWFSLAASLSDAIGLGLDRTVILMSSVALLFSVGLAYHIRRVTVGTTIWFVIVPLVVLTVLPILYKNVFGLREHLVLLGLWPYLVLRLSDPEGTIIGWKTRLLLGVWLGVTLLFKYLYALVVLLVELADAGIQRRPILLFRVENLVSGAMVAAYLLFWLVLDPEQREAMSAIVSAIDANLTNFNTNMLQAAIHGALALFFVVLAVYFKQSARTTLIGLAMVVAAIAAAWIQSRWYSHHLFPITMAYAAWLWMVHKDTRLLLLVAVAVILARPVLGEYRNTAIYQVTTNQLDEAMEEANLSIEGRRVGVLTMHPSPFNQHLASHGAIRWNTSMNNSYVATALKPLDRPENTDVIAPAVDLDDPGMQLLHNEMLQLWEDMPPEMLILDQSTSWPLRHLKVEWEQVFANDERFNAVLAQYEPVLEHKGERLEFTVYERAQ